MLIHGTFLYPPCQVCWLNSPDLWYSPCPSRPSTGQPPYRLRIEATRSMTHSLPQSALHWAATLRTEDWTHQIYDTFLAPVGPPLGGHLTDWVLNSPDLWHSPCPSQASIGRPPYRLRIEPTRSMTQSLPQSGLHWAATLQTEDWTYQIYDTFLAPVGPPLGGHLKDWGLNSPDLWHSPCPSQPSIGRPPYRLRIEPTRSMTQSLPQSALHWAATLQTEDWTYQIYDTVLAPVGPPLGGHLTDVHDGLGVVGVHVEDGRVDDARDVGAVGRGTRHTRVRREADLRERETTVTYFFTVWPCVTWVFSQRAWKVSHQ